MTIGVALLAWVLVFDKVLSAQYPLWLAGLVSIAVCRRDSPLRVVVLPTAAVLLLTQLVYPLSIQGLIGTSDVRPVLVVVVRAVLLVLIACLAVRAAWRLGHDEGPAAVKTRPARAG